jgi:DNA polymerase III sliding clamp (beta) subunit (PCNA family)
VTFIVTSKTANLVSKDLFGNMSTALLDVTLKAEGLKSFEFSVYGEYLIQAIKEIKDKSLEVVVTENAVYLKSKDSFGIIPIMRG